MRKTFVLLFLALPLIAHAEGDFANNQDEILKMLTGEESVGVDTLVKKKSKVNKRKRRGLKVVKRDLSLRDKFRKNLNTVVTELGEVKRYDLPQTSHKVNLKIEFDVNSQNIRSSSLVLLKELGQTLTLDAFSDDKFLVGGHTDSDGDDKHNFNLSLERAKAIKKFLVDVSGVDAEKLQVVGYGENYPLRSNYSMTGKQHNRRVEILRVK
jgi:outer membrane protein OmpA-like peptidoglycan-associated protein